jgi:taurine dioxygenase
MNNLMKQLAEEGTVILKKQKMTDQEFNDYVLSLGKHLTDNWFVRHSKFPALFRITNKTLENGKRGVFSQGELEWHCNSSCCLDPEEVVVLYGKKVIKDAPTIIAYSTKMYNDLPQTLKDELDDVEVIIKNYKNISGNGGIYTSEDGYDVKDHARFDEYNFRSRDGLMTMKSHPKMKAKQLKNGRWLISVKKKLVQVHPVTKQKVLYFPFPSMADFHHKQELIDRLMQPKYIYHHEWEEGDIMFMDQITTIHKRENTLLVPEERELYRAAFYYGN